MNVLVDTSVWSHALRRRNPSHEAPEVMELRELIGEQRVRIIGPIRQELLSGIASERQFISVRDHLRAFGDEPLNREDHERAAEIFNLCRGNGVQGSAINFLICAVAERRRWALFTSDGDFHHYSRYVPIALYFPRQG